MPKLFNKGKVSTRQGGGRGSKMPNTSYFMNTEQPLKSLRDKFIPVHTGAGKGYIQWAKIS